MTGQPPPQLLSWETHTHRPIKRASELRINALTLHTHTAGTISLSDSLLPLCPPSSQYNSINRSDRFPNSQNRRIQMNSCIVIGEEDDLRDASRTHYVTFQCPSECVLHRLSILNLTVSLGTAGWALAASLSLLILLTKSYINQHKRKTKHVSLRYCVLYSGEGRQMKPQPHICSGKVHNSSKMSQFEDRPEEQLVPSVPSFSNYKNM